LQSCTHCANFKTLVVNLRDTRQGQQFKLCECERDASIGLVSRTSVLNFIARSISETAVALRFLFAAAARCFCAAHCSGAHTHIIWYCESAFRLFLTWRRGLPSFIRIDWPFARRVRVSHAACQLEVRGWNY
jgi:hypothetical protein